jgi:hypothetical protein
MTERVSTHEDLRITTPTAAENFVCATQSCRYLISGPLLHGWLAAGALIFTVICIATSLYSFEPCLYKKMDIVN